MLLTGSLSAKFNSIIPKYALITNLPFLQKETQSLQLWRLQISERQIPLLFLLFYHLVQVIAPYILQVLLSMYRDGIQ